MADRFPTAGESMEHCTHDHDGGFLADNNNNCDRRIELDHAHAHAHADADDNWELYNRQKATVARLVELEKQAEARRASADAELYANRNKSQGFAAMGEAQSTYFPTNLDALPDYLNVGDKNKRRDRAPVDREEAVYTHGEDALENIKSIVSTARGKFLESVNNAWFGANTSKRVAVDRSEVVMSAEVALEVHDSDDGGMPDLEAVRGPAAGESKERLVRALMMVSHASLFVGVSAGVRQPTTIGHQAAYSGVVAAILAAVPVEMATAFWLRRSSNPRFQVFAQGLQSAGLMLLITVAAASGIGLALRA